MFRYYSNMVSQASRTVATGTFMFGLVLIGFGVLILALPEVFAMLAAIIFFLAGAGCATTALKIYLAQRHIDKMSNKQGQDVYRENVRVRIEDRDII